MTRHLGKGTALLFVTALVSGVAGGCGGLTSKPPGVTPPVEETREHVITIENKVMTATKNLSFDKKPRTLVAAKNLGNYGADAASAIPELRKLINQEPDTDSGFPDEEQKAAFKDALEKITADMTAKGIPIPPEGAAAAPAGGEAKK